jgi:hypothetical protein
VLELEDEDCEGVPVPVFRVLDKTLVMEPELDMTVVIVDAEVIVPESLKPPDMVPAGELVLETTVVIDGVDIAALPPLCPLKSLAVAVTVVVTKVVTATVSSELLLAVAVVCEPTGAVTLTVWMEVTVTIMRSLFATESTVEVGGSFQISGLCE